MERELSVNEVNKDSLIEKEAVPVHKEEEKGQNHRKWKGNCP
jgi:hypothetical protein